MRTVLHMLSALPLLLPLFADAQTREPTFRSRLLSSSTVTDSAGIRREIEAVLDRAGTMIVVESAGRVRWPSAVSPRIPCSEFMPNSIHPAAPMSTFALTPMRFDLGRSPGLILESGLVSASDPARVEPAAMIVATYLRVWVRDRGEWAVEAACINNGLRKAKDPS